MAQVVGGQVKLSNGQVVTPQNGGWYDGQQFVNNTLSNPGQINPLSSQQGAGQQVSKEVIAQTNPNNVAYVQQQQQKQQQGDPSIVANAPAGGGGAAVGAGTGTNGGMGGVDAVTPANVPNLLSDYQGLQASSGIKALQDELTAKQQSFNDAQSKINDNPWLSEADRVGRVQKLTNDYNNDTKTTQDQIATATADNQMKIQLEQKQFDINSAAAQQSLSQFNTLLGMGALDNASGQDIAAITQSTGLSSNMIQAAVNANKVKNIKTSIIQYDDGTNQGFAVINADTGQVISKQTVAASKPTKGSTTTDKLKPADYANFLVKDTKNGADLKSIVANYRPYLPIDQIYQLYNSSGSPYGKAKETLAQIKAGKYSD